MIQPSDILIVWIFMALSVEIITNKQDSTLRDKAI